MHGSCNQQNRVVPISLEALNFNNDSGIKDIFASGSYTIDLPSYQNEPEPFFSHHKTARRNYFFYYSVGKTCKIQALRYNRHAVDRPEPK